MATKTTVGKAPAKAGGTSASTEIVKHDANLTLRLKQLAMKTRQISGKTQSPFKFILIAQKNSKVTDEDEEVYIDGLELGELYVMQDKLRLGKQLDVVPLMYIKAFGEYALDEKNPKAPPTFLGVWHEEDAMYFPIKENTYFDRELPNGNVLRPIRWIPVFIPDYPELTDIALAFKSDANKIADSWFKDALSRGIGLFSSLYTIKTEIVKRDTFKWYQLVPVFKAPIISMAQDDVKFHAPYAERVIELAETFVNKYENGELIPRKNLESIIGYKKVEVVEDKKPLLLKSDDSDDEEIPF